MFCRYRKDILKITDLGISWTYAGGRWWYFADTQWKRIP